MCNSRIYHPLATGFLTLLSLSKSYVELIYSPTIPHVCTEIFEKTKILENLAKMFSFCLNINKNSE